MSQEPRSRTNTVAKELALANAHASRWVAGTVASLVHFGDEYLACFVTTEILRKHHMTARDLVDLGARRVKLSLVVTVVTKSFTPSFENSGSSFSSSRGMS